VTGYEMDDQSSVPSRTGTFHCHV